MSPIATLQRQLRELGRIRTGASRPGRGGRKVPHRLETFRLTSRTRELIEHAADAFGGQVEPWEGQWQVITETPALDIVIPPGEIVSQWYELWGGGGCLRRCDGNVNVLTMGACECPTDYAERNELAAKGEACKPTTRLRIMLPAVPDIGTWLLETHGYYAATELAGAADVLAAATARGILLPARLRLDDRERRTPGRPTKRWTVPVIEFVQTKMSDLLELPATGTVVPRLGAGEIAVLEPPRAPLDATSDFRAPVGPFDDDDSGEASDRPSAGPDTGLPSDASQPDDATDGIELTELGRSIREVHGRVRGTPEAIIPSTDQQKATLQIAFRGMAAEDISRGVEIVFGHPLPLRDAGEATALIGQLALMAPEEFQHAWRGMLEAGRPL